MVRWILWTAVVLVGGGAVSAQEKEQAVEELAEQTRKSVVVITVEGRDGKREGLGTGFVISADGLVATNHHVIGEGRGVLVETADGKKHEPVSVHASDRKLDLAVLRLDAKGLTPLALGSSKGLKDGQSVVALGHPQRLRYSVVAGVVSGQREIDGRPMIQMAIPIEPGNSGGPVLDRQGRVVGVVTSRSALTDNLGFAVSVDMLRAMVAKPNPVPMKAWLTIGTLDPEEWKPVGDARWRQRAGQILVEGGGGGFGGRSLCLAQQKAPALPFEAAVTVKLEEESGAAGLVFHSDGADRHYGFYPSNGQLRFTRFDGPTVFSWTVLRQEPVAGYRPGEWNTLKVRVEKGKFRCFVNDQAAFEVEDEAFDGGQVGLAKFRDTVAAFRRFRVAREVPSLLPPAKAAERILEAVGKASLPQVPSAEVVRRLTPDAPGSLAVLRERARELEKQAEKLRQLAQAVHQRSVLEELKRVTDGKDEEIDLLHAALLIARLDNEEVLVEEYREEVERMARKVASGLAKEKDEASKLAALNRFLFEERGFHGSRSDYYNRSNSYLSEVIDDREGLPITLSLLYLELGRRLGLKLEGVGLPGHFVVRHRPAKGEGKLVDVFDRGRVLSREEAARKVEDTTGEPLQEEDLAAVGARAILTRILHNLIGVAQSEDDPASALRYVDAILTITPDAAMERGMRAALRARQGDRKGAVEDLDWLLDKEPEGVDLEKVRRFRTILSQ